MSDEAQRQGDGAVKRRRRAFKGRIELLAKRAQDSALLRPTFTSEGPGLSLTNYIEQIFKASLNEVNMLTELVRTELRAVTWDPQDTACISSFQRIIGALDRSITLVTTLPNQLPPIEVRAAHRILTRAVGQMIQGYVTIIEALIAVDLDEARERQQEGQQLFLLGARTLEPLQQILNHVSKQSSPGWWMSGDVLDLAAIAWERIENNASMTINQTANLVRVALARIPGVTDLSDAEALLLLPATILPVTIVDPVLLQERAGLIRDGLTTTDLAIPDWIQDPAELVLRVSEGIRAVIEQTERLGFATIGPASRRITIHLLADVYLKLVEGPLRDLGSVVVIAIRAVRGDPNRRFIPEIARGVQAGETVQELERLGALWSHAVRMLVRNANAHAGVRVLDAGVALTQRRIENGVVADEKTIEMSDAEFAEEFARLSETCLALQLGIVPWLFTHQSAEVVRARQAASPTQRESESIVRLLAGLQGLLQVEVERDGKTLIVRAVAAEGTDARSPHIPYLAPVIFQSWSDVDTVMLNISPRDPVTYERTDLPGVNPLSGNQDLVAVGLMGRKWLGELSGDAAIKADITFLIRPVLNALREAIGHASTSPASIAHIAEAHARVVALTNRLRRAQLPPPGTSLVSEVREAAHNATRRLDRLRWAFVGTESREQQRQMRSCAALLEQIGSIEQRAIDEFHRIEAAETAQ